MLTTDEVLNLNYYKKTTYTGWINGMRFLIKREAPEEGDALRIPWCVFCGSGSVAGYGNHASDCISCLEASDV